MILTKGPLTCCLCQKPVSWRSINCRHCHLKRPDEARAMRKRMRALTQEIRRRRQAALPPPAYCKLEFPSQEKP